MLLNSQIYSNIHLKWISLCAITSPCKVHMWDSNYLYSDILLVSIYRPLDWCKSTPLITTMNEMLWNVRLHYLRLSPAPSPAWSSRAVSGLATISMLSIALFQHFPTPPHVPVKWNVQIMLQSAHNLWSVVKILQLAINICSVLACLVSTKCDMMGRIDSSETE